MDENNDKLYIDTENKRESLKRTMQAQQSYLDHYDNAKDKISAAKDIICINNEIEKINNKIHEMLLNKLELFEGVDKDDDDIKEWVSMTNTVFTLASNGFKVKPESYNYLAELTERLTLPAYIYREMKLFLLGCSRLADKKLRHESIEDLTTYVIENDFPPHIPIEGRFPSKDNDLNELIEYAIDKVAWRISDRSNVHQYRDIKQILVYYYKAKANGEKKTHKIVVESTGIDVPPATLSTWKRHVREELDQAAKEDLEI